jgi:hypothetical protein
MVQAPNAKPPTPPPESVFLGLPQGSVGDPVDRDPVDLEDNAEGT